MTIKEDLLIRELMGVMQKYHLSAFVGSFSGIRPGLITTIRLTQPGVPVGPYVQLETRFRLAVNEQFGTDESGHESGVIKGPPSNI